MQGAPLLRTFYLNHSPINFYFNQTPKDFVVTEVPLYEFSNDGEHLILKIAKKGISSWEALGIISSNCGIPIKEIGYAGLKDKQAYTIQHISINRKFEPNLERLSDERLKVVERFYHKNKIKQGHLKGNKFFIRVKKLNPIDAKKVQSAVLGIKKYGIPNFFGYQRFGRDGENAKRGQELCKEGKKRFNYKDEFFINAYQSELFNAWLAKRIEISKIVDGFSDKECALALGFDRDDIAILKAQSHPFKLMKGEIYCHYPHGKLFTDEDILEQSRRFIEQKISPTGLLCGVKSEVASSRAGEIERDFLDGTIPLQGSRRYAWIWPEDLEFNYKEEEAWGEFSFFLPKGSYATVVLEQIKCDEIVGISEE